MPVSRRRKPATISPTGRTIAKSPFLGMPYGLPISPRRNDVVSDPYAYLAAVDYSEIERRALTHYCSGDTGIAAALGTAAHEFMIAGLQAEAALKRFSRITTCNLAPGEEPVTIDNDLQRRLEDERAVDRLSTSTSTRALLR